MPQIASLRVSLGSLAIVVRSNSFTQSLDYMSGDKIWRFIVGVVALLVAFFILCPLLGAYAGIGQLFVDIVAIIWVLKEG